jgi:hypothetical protein
MRISAFSIALLLMSRGVASAAASAGESSLSDTIHRCLDVPTFDASCLGVFSTVVVIDEDHRHAYDRGEQIAYFDRLKKGETPPIISSFEMLGEIDDGAYASVTYRYLFTSAIQHSLVRAQMDAHDVWERGPSGWTRITSVLRRTSETTIQPQ